MKEGRVLTSAAANGTDGRAPHLLSVDATMEARRASGMTSAWHVA